jgi:DNA-directed RNA polymerase subunit N (RpoN/RPB10)
MRKQPNRKSVYQTHTNNGRTPEQILKDLGLTREKVSTLTMLSRLGIPKKALR